MSDENAHITDLQSARDHLVAYRRRLATNKAAEDVALVQVQIEAIDRAIADEIAIAGKTRGPTVRRV